MANRWFMKKIKRNESRLNAIRALPCIECGAPPPSQACHSNFQEHGKGMGTKADDEYTIPLCHNCHIRFDQYADLNRNNAKVWFMRHWHSVQRALNGDDDEDEL